MLYPLLLAALYTTRAVSMQLHSSDVWLSDPILGRRNIDKDTLQVRGLGFLTRDPRRGASPMQRAQNIHSSAIGDTRPSSPIGNRPSSVSPPQQRPQSPHQQSAFAVPPPPPPPRRLSTEGPSLAANNQNGRGMARQLSRMHSVEYEAQSPSSSQGGGRLSRQASRQQSVEYEQIPPPSNHQQETSRLGRAGSADAGLRTTRAMSPNRSLAPNERPSPSEDAPAPRARVQPAILGRESLHSLLRTPQEEEAPANIVGAVRGPAKVRASGAHGPAEHWRLQPGEAALIGPSNTRTTSVKARVLSQNGSQGEIALVANARREAMVRVTTDAGGSGSIHFRKPENLAASQQLVGDQTGTASGEVVERPGNVVVSGDLKGAGKMIAKAEDPGQLRRNSGSFYR